VDLITALLGLYFAFGVWLDIYAHNHSKPESFFTPWHAVLCTGYLAVAIWLALRGLYTSGSVDRLGRLGIVMFGVAGVADMGWHLVRGMERGTAVPISPPHLLLLVSGWLIVTVPVRNALARERGAVIPWPAVLGIATATVAMAFPTQQFVVFAKRWDVAAKLETGQQLVGSAPAMNWDFFAYGQVLPLVVGTTVLMVGSLIYALIAFRSRPGMVSAIFAIVVLNCSLGRGFEEPAITGCAVLAGVAIDVLLQRFARRRSPKDQVRFIGWVAPVLLWLFVFVAGAITGALDGWPAEIVGGAFAMAVLSGALLAKLVTTAAELSIDEQPTSTSDVSSVAITGPTRVGGRLPASDDS